MNCTVESHAALKRTADTWDASTENRRFWVMRDGDWTDTLLLGECIHCHSTLSVHVDAGESQAVAA